MANTLLFKNVNPILARVLALVRVVVQLKCPGSTKLQVFGL